MRLNLGSGNDYREGWVNIDSGECHCDLHHDLCTFPWPVDESTVDEIVIQHMLEHISPKVFPQFVRQMWRVCKHGAVINILSPKAGSDNFWTDPTHKMPLTLRTFDFFDPSKPLHENGVIYGWGDITLTVLKALDVDNPPNGPDVSFQLEVVK